MSTEISMAKTDVQGRKNAYENYGRYETKWDIVTDVVEKVQKQISYAYALYQVY